MVVGVEGVGLRTVVHCNLHANKQISPASPENHPPPLNVWPSLSHRFVCFHHPTTSNLLCLFLRLYMCVYVRSTFQSTLEWNVKKIIIKARIIWQASGLADGWGVESGAAAKRKWMRITKVAQIVWHVWDVACGYKREKDIVSLNC